MNLSRRLPRFESRMEALERQILEHITPSVCDMDRVFIVERAVIQIQVEWDNFVRGVILDSATGRYSNRSGAIFSQSHPSLRTRECAAAKLITLYPRRRYEPDWYLPQDAIDAAQRLGISNYPTISLELGVTPWVIDDLRHIRNFIGHKSKRSALSVREAGLVATSSSINVVAVASSYGASGARKFQEWISFSKGVARRITI